MYRAGFSTEVIHSSFSDSPPRDKQIVGASTDVDMRRRKTLPDPRSTPSHRTQATWRSGPGLQGVPPGGRLEAYTYLTRESGGSLHA